MPVLHYQGALVRKITKVIIHCSATPPDMEIGAETIRVWHVKDNGWADIGYHWVIRRDGQVEAGRPEAMQGAHCAAGNGNVASIGICLMGGVRRKLDAAGNPVKKNGKPVFLIEDNFTTEQWNALKKLVRDLQRRYPEIATILGHRDLDPGKECPSFSVRDWARTEQILEPEWPDFSNVISAVTSTERFA